MSAVTAVLSPPVVGIGTWFVAVVCSSVVDSEPEGVVVCGPRKMVVYLVRPSRVTVRVTRYGMASRGSFDAMIVIGRVSVALANYEP